MLPLLIVLGATGALLEIKRLVNRPPQDGDAIRLKQSEERLRRVLQASLITLARKYLLTMTTRPFFWKFVSRSILPTAETSLVNATLGAHVSYMSA